MLWMEVQRTWSYLESIFIGSEDIRKQLPEDSDRRDIVFLKTLLHVGQRDYQLDNRFDRIDKEFKGMMTEAKKEKNVIRATGVGSSSIPQPPKLLQILEDTDKLSGSWYGRAAGEDPVRVVPLREGGRCFLQQVI